MSPTIVAGRFELVRLAGTGGMGRVFEAVDRVTGLRAAVKLLKADRVHHARFEREGEVLATLRDPGIVRYLAHGAAADGELFLAMEWLAGEDLGQRFRRASLSIEQSLALVARAARALDAAHRCGVVHRDIKPGNLFLVDRAPERVKVIDFGLARTTADTERLTMSGMLFGTPAFMAPEQARSVKDAGAAADVFSLGCVLFKCLTGRAPFDGDDALSILMKIAMDEAPRAADLVASLPAGLDDLVAAMLSKAPEDRPSSCAEIADILSAMARGAPHPDRAPMSVGRPAVGHAEQRLLFLLLARAIDKASVASTAPGDAPQSAPPGPLSGLASTPSHDDLDAGELRDLAARYGGALHVMVDGSLFVTLPASRGAAEHGVLAARCALALRAFLPDAPMVLACGRASVSGAAPTGPLIDQAVALASHAPPPAPQRGIRIDPLVASLLDHRFEVTAEAGGAVLIGEIARAPGTRTLLGAPSPYVGRDRDVWRLLSIFEESMSEPAARAVIVTAAAGMGKTRLKEEVIARMSAAERRSSPAHDSASPPADAAPRIWMTWGDPMGNHSAFGLIHLLLRSASQERETGDPAAEAARLEARLSRPTRPDAPSPASELDGLRSQFLAWLGAHLRRGPVAIVVDDLHWGDAPSVAFLDAALEAFSSEPLFVLALARPEVHDVFPSLWERRPSTQVKLAPLSRKSADALVRAALGADAPARLRAIVDRANGNAFFLEELIRRAAQGPAQTGMLPDTVLGLAGARLEALGAEERRVLRAASVFGATFSKEGAKALLRGATTNIDESLVRLVAAEVIAAQSPEDRGNAPGTFPEAGSAAREAIYAFRHILVRDAAYAMLSADDRRESHARAGAYLESRGGADVGVLAEHFERGDDPRAFHYGYLAALGALAGGDFDGAEARVSVLGAKGQGPAALGPIRVLEGEIHIWRGRYKLAGERFQEAIPAFSAGSAVWWYAVLGAFTAVGGDGDMPAAVRLLDEIARHELPLDVPSHTTWRAAETVQFAASLGANDAAELLLGKLRRFAEQRERSLGDKPRSFEDEAHMDAIQWADDVGAAYAEADPWRCFRRIQEGVAANACRGDRLAHVMLQIELAHAHTRVGGHREAIEILVRCRAETKPLGIPLANALIALGTCRAWLFAGKGAEGEALANEARTYIAEGSTYWASATSMWAMARLLQGDFTSALMIAREQQRMHAGTPIVYAVAIALEANALLALGETEALDVVEKLEEVSRGASGRMRDWALFFALTHVRALLAAGAQDRARELLEQTRSDLLKSASCFPEGPLRTRFLEEMPVHVALLQLAGAMCK